MASESRSKIMNKFTEMKNECIKMREYFAATKRKYEDLYAKRQQLEVKLQELEELKKQTKLNLKDIAKLRAEWVVWDKHLKKVKKDTEKLKKAK